MYKIRYSLLTLAIFFTITAGFLLYTTVNSQTPPTPIITVGSVELIPNQPVTVPITLSEFDQASLGSVMLTVRYDASLFAPASCMADPDELFELMGCAIHPSDEGTQSEALFTLINGQNIPAAMTTVLGTMVLTPMAEVSGTVGLVLEVREFVDLGGEAVVYEINDWAGVVGTESSNKVYLPLINR